MPGEPPMNLAPTEEQEALVASFADLLAAHATPERVRAAEATAGFDPELWKALRDVGVVEMAVPETHGGWGADLLDLALVAERMGAAAAAAPVVETQVAARLLAALDIAAGRAALATAVGGERLVTIAVRPAVDGVASLVPGAAVAEEAVVLDGDRLLLVPLRDGTRTAVANLAAAPLADVTLGPGAIELARGAAAVGAFEAALDDWLVLTAGALVGLGTAAHRLTVGYAKERRAWDLPIGAYQAVAHPLANGATALDGARLLVARAAGELARGGPRGRELAAMAFAFAAETARQVTYDGVHFHGGNGFTLEFDAQLYYRRARGWARVWGEPRDAYRRAARVRYGRGQGPGRIVDLGVDESVAALRAEVRAFLAEELTPELEERVYRSGVSHDDTFVRRLAERGWLAPGWDRGDGRRALDPYEAHVVVDELTKAEAPVYAIGTTEMVANVIRAVGSEALRAEILPGFLRGEVTIALGMTEPEVGSDVAGVRTRARWDGERWVVNGQKMFTTNGHITDYIFLLTRTRPDGPKHAGLTMFLVRLDQPGIEAQAVYTLSGERTNIVYLSDVVVEDRWRIGAVDGGWQALMIALQDEHSAPFSPHLARLIEAVAQWAHERGRIDEPDVRERLGRWATALEVAQLLELRTTWMVANGQVPVAEGPMSKLFSTESLVHAAEDLTELVGPDALRSRLDPTAVVGGRIEHALRFSLGTAIYAGTSEIQRNIIAQQRCGLPRK
ncbi:acyl-CoA dehydrogenase [Pseudofrankia sp. BMG5.36]|uniref:acyl-CoA dehydrogenase n=1 Tax=Pseudofrankia sp. BMG5.36 TaxID=1834512 RepID=UPI000B06A975|nr:acyl-CoA dehydrogenase [Pseudofrankia sp. BMG5.36]